VIVPERKPGVMEMTFEEFSEACARTDNPNRMPGEHITYHSLKIAGEAGEIADLVGKWLGQGHELRKELLKEEIGDVMWHLDRLSAALGTTLEELCKLNEEKLRKRYPDGFSTEKSLNRTT
jgi:NTP pyrophosphatase (non-canonical NTP hydrolase)